MPKPKNLQNVPPVFNEPDEEEIVSQPELQPETEVSAKKLPEKTASALRNTKKRKKLKNKKKNTISIFTSFFSALFSKLHKGIRQSGVARVLSAREKTAEIFRRTWLYSIFFSKRNTERVKNIKVKFRRATTDAAIPKLLGQVSKALLNVKSRIYGLIFFLFGITTVAVHYLINSRTDMFIYDAYAPFTAGCVCLVALFFLFSNDTLSQSVFESKLLGSLVFDLMGIKYSSSDSSTYLELSSVGACAIGVLLGLLTMVFPARSVLLVILLLIYAVLVIKSPEAGIISILIMTPFVSLEILVLAIVLLTVSYMFKALCGKRTIKLEFSDIPVALFMLTVLSAEAVSFGGKGTPITSVVFIAAYFIAVSILRSEVWFKRAVRSVTIGVSVISVGAVLFYFLGEFANTGILTGFSVVDHRETVSQVLLYTVFIVIGMFLKEKSTNVKFGLLLIIVFSIVYLSMTLPSEAILAAVIALVIFVLLYNPKTIVPIIILGVLCVVLSYWGVGGLIVGNTNFEKRSIVGSNVLIELLSQFGFVGIGSADSAWEVLHSSVSIGSSTAVIEESDLFFALALELGYIGVAMFIISFFFILQNAFSYGKICTERTDRYRVVSYAAMSGLIAAFIYGLWKNIFATPRMMLVFWLLAGITVAGSRSSRERTVGATQELTGLSPEWY